MGYRKVDGVFWTDPKVRDLTEQERYLFLYCITCPSAHSSGIYYNPLPMIAYETCINEKALVKAFGRLKEGLMVYYGSLSGVVFVRNMLKFQTPNAKEKISIQKHIETIQDKEILAMFLNTYPEYIKGYSKAIETLSEGYHKGIHTETDTKTETKTDTKTEKSVESFELFKQAYENYPEGCKRNAETEFNWLKKQHNDWKKILPLLKDSMLAYNQFIKSQLIKKPDYTVKHMQGWLTERRWEMYQLKEEIQEPELEFVGGFNDN
jgi:predicted Fe-S protein YdhL (DUF1289 family)